MKKYLSPLEVARLLNLDVSSIRKKLRKGVLKAYKQNDNWFVEYDSVLQYQNKTSLKTEAEAEVIPDNIDDDFLGDINSREIIVKDLPEKGKKKYYIITAAQNNTQINEDFFNNILALKNHFNAELLVSRLTYNKNALNTARGKDTATDENNSKIRYSTKLLPYLNDDYLKLSNDLVYLGYRDKLITSPNPLSSTYHTGWDCSFILPHGRRQLESFPLTYEKSLTKRKIGYTSGVVTKRNYIQNDAGHKAEIYHFYGVCLVQVNDDGSHFTYQLPASEDGNYSICHKDIMVVGGKVLKNQSIKALALGDLHCIKGYQTKEFQHFFGKDNMFKGLHIKNIITHDTLDFECQSHHTEKDYLTRYVQHHTTDSDVFKELKITVDVINDVSKLADRLYVVESNHDQHLNKYLNGNWKIDDHVNKLTNLLLNTIQYTKATVDNNINTSLTEHCQYKPFLQIMEDCRKHNGDIYEFVARQMIGLSNNVEFIDGNKDIYIMDYLLNLHGDKGVNGSRSAHSLKRLSEKTITGHVHSPCIRDFLIVLGITGDKSKFKYASSPSSWATAFSMIHANGTAVMYFYENGQF